MDDERYIDVPADIPRARTMEVASCVNCNSVHLLFWDSDGELIAVSLFSTEIADLLASQLQRQAQEIRARKLN